MTKQEAPATIISALSDEELKLLTSLTAVSRWLVYLSVILPALFFLLDIGFDVALVTTYWRNGQNSEAIVTVLVLVFAGVVTSVYYYFNEKWIDTALDLPPQNRQAVQLVSSSQSYPEQKDDIEFHNLHPRGSDVLDAQQNGNNVSSSGPRASTSKAQQVSSEQRVATNSYANQERIIVISPASSNGHQSRAWPLFRQLSRITLLSPIFRAYYLVTKLGSSIDIIENARLTRKLPSKRELDAIVMIRDSQINQACFNMIETNFEALPQTLLQIYLAVHLKLTFELDNWADAIIYLTIIWSIFSAAYSATSYSAAYYLHSKIARAMDDLFIGGHINQKGLRPVSWYTLILTFFFNLVVIVGRIYGLSNVLVTRGVWALLIFVAILFITQFLWLEIFPDQRMFYENPTRGITTPCSNLVDRWKNIFCFHQILPSAKSIFVYHGIFVFLFLAFYVISEAVFGRHAQYLPETPNKNQTDHANFSTISSNLNTSNNSDFKAQGKQDCDFNAFPKTCNLSHVILNGYGVFIYWVISLLISLVYLHIRKTRDKILLEKYFPSLKGIDMWLQLTQGENLRNASIERKRALCLSIMANDKDMQNIIGKCPCFFNAGKLGVDFAKSLNQKLLKVWESYIDRCKHGWLIELENETQRELMSLHWEKLKSCKGTNESGLGNYKNYVQKLNEMIDPLFEDPTVSFDDLQVFMHFYDNFERKLNNSNSFRLGKVDVLFAFGNLDKKKCSLSVSFACIWC